MGQLRWFSALLLLVACRAPEQSRKVDGVSRRDTVVVSVAAVPEMFMSEENIPTDSNGYAVGKTISKNDFPKPGLIIPGEFSCDSVMVRLFPGNVYRHNETFICWKCPDCEKRHFPDAEDMGTIAFPHDEGNETRYLDTTAWTQPDGTRYLLFAFSSSEPTTDFICMGRFLRGNLGLALFREVAQGWKLQAFDPYVISSGLFQQADRPEVCVTGKSAFLILVPDHICGAGSPLWSSMTLFAVSGTRFHAVSGKMEWGISNRLTEWSSSVLPAYLLDSRFPPIVISTQGQLYKDDISIVGENDNIPEAAPWFEKNDAFKFRRTQQLEYVNGKYVVTKTAFRADTTWKPGNGIY